MGGYTLYSEFVLCRAPYIGAGDGDAIFPHTSTYSLWGDGYTVFVIAESHIRARDAIFPIHVNLPAYSPFGASDLLVEFMGLENIDSLAFVPIV